MVLSICRISSESFAAVNILIKLDELLTALIFYSKIQGHAWEPSKYMDRKFAKLILSPENARTLSFSIGIHNFRASAKNNCSMLLVPKHENAGLGRKMPFLDGHELCIGS
jgi:hypothetical protein